MDGLVATDVDVEAQAPVRERAGRRGPGSSAIGTLIVVAVTAAILLAVAYLSDRHDTLDAGSVTAVTVDGTASGAPPTIGQPAPDFTAADADGTPVKLSSFIGRPVWLTFGASWCQPCRAENPDIEATYRAVSDQIVVLQVYMSEDAATVNDYRDRVGLSYLTVPDPSERLASQYRILGIPSHFFIDATGVLREMRIGSLDPAAMQAAIARIHQ